MATNTYVALDKVTVGSSVGSITLNMGSTISQAYTDLIIVCNGTATGNTGLYAQFNGNTTGGKYSLTVLEGSGTTATSERQNSVDYARFVWNSLWNTTTPGVAVLHINNYSSTAVFKTILWRSSTSSNYVESGVNLWRDLSAITSITITGSSANIAAGSTFSLYGIKATSTGTGTAKATGGTITYDSFGYVYHTFGSTASFTPSVPLTCDYLVVGGGGGGGARFGGGGGAGGLRSTMQTTGGGAGLEAPISVAATAYTITVGSPGSGAAVGANGTNGNSSTFSTITSAGGGGGGGTISTGTGSSGGSGGGGTGVYNDTVGQGIGGTATTAQGYDGGIGGKLPDNVYYRAGGGGGGAGAKGTNVVNGSAFGVGGAGVLLPLWATTTSTGSSNYYAGGGGGGIYGGSSVAAGGAGGGGAGSINATGGAGTAGTSNTGSGGGGGGGDSSTGGNGGSGIVIIRYYGL